VKMAAKEDPSSTKYTISKLNLMYFSYVVMLQKFNFSVIL